MKMIFCKINYMDQLKKDLIFVIFYPNIMQIYIYVCV